MASVPAVWRTLKEIAGPDKTLDGVARIRLDAAVTAVRSDKELAEPDFKGFRLLTERPGASSQCRARLRVVYGPCTCRAGRSRIAGEPIQNVTTAGRDMAGSSHAGSSH